jgi:hypothetical protein
VCRWVYPANFTTPRTREQRHPNSRSRLLTAMLGDSLHGLDTGVFVALVVFRQALDARAVVLGDLALALCLGEGGFNGAQTAVDRGRCVAATHIRRLR